MNDELLQSTRSRIVKATIERIIPPEPCTSVIANRDGHIVSLCILADRTKPIEKFEVYRKELSLHVPSVADRAVQVIHGPDGFTIENEIVQVTSNAFSFIGESLNTRFGGSVFRDDLIVAGKKYAYRVYAVDIYGNKAQDPKEVVVFVNERGTRSDDVRRPTALAEVDSETNKVKLTIISDDDRVVAFFMSRKDLTLNEKAFTTPTQPSYIRRGNCPSHGCKTFEDTIMRDSPNVWTGYFQNVGDPIVFVDQTSRVDHTYQYCVFAVDKFGGETSCDITPPLFVSRRPKVDRPTNFVSQVTGLSGSVTVTLTWDDGNLDIEPEQLLGNREELEFTSVRTLYQLERKRVPGELWEQFPMFDEATFSETTAQLGEVPPSFRPEFIEVDSMYMYRVAAFQTGGFISNFTKPIQVATFVPVVPPTDLRVRSCDSGCEPFFVALNWDTDESSGEVDRWIVDRVEVNNFAASRLNLTNPGAVDNLDFQNVAEVFAESGNSTSRVNEMRMPDEVARDVSNQNIVLSGQHHYIDSDVRFGNTYFYRVRAVGLNANNVSAFVSKGIRVADTAFDKKLNAVITQTERNTLSATVVPLGIKGNIVRTHGGAK